MKTIWFVYPYGSIPMENTLDMRYIRFGKRLSKKYKCVWWTSNFSNDEKQYRSKEKKTIELNKNLSIVLVPTTGYTKNISVKRVLFELNYARSLKRIWKNNERPDIIITPGTGVVTAFRPIWPFIKETKIKVIFDIMDVHPLQLFIKKRSPIFYPFIKLVFEINNLREKRFYQSVSGVTGLARQQVKIAKARVKNKNIPCCLIYNSINVHAFRKQMTIPNNGICLPLKKEGWIWCIYAGSLGPSHDIPTIIDCAEKCNRNGNKVLFIVAGSGDYSSACEHASNEHLVFLGYLDKNVLPWVYSKCDIGLSTYADFSTVEMPDKFYDYTAAGLAIVNSLNGEVRDHIKKYELGVQYRSGDTDDLYKKICLFENHDFLCSCKKNSWRIAYKYDLDKQMDVLEEFVDSLIETNSQA